ncbi:MAG: hypothetical protein AB7T63_05050 [Planctomycetota bacterium]
MDVLWEPRPEHLAEVHAGRALADAGRGDEAEQHLRELVRTTRGGHPGDEVLALRTLMTLYGRAGRYLEAHLLGVRIQALAESGGATARPALAHGLTGQCGALAKLHLVDELAPTLGQLRRVLDALEAPMPGLEMGYCSAAGTLAMLCDDLATARAHVERYRAFFEREGHGMESIYRWALAMMDAHVALREGHPRVAQGIFARVARLGLTPPFRRLGQLPLEVNAACLLGNVEDALRLGRETLELLEATRGQPLLRAESIHEGNAVARQLEAMDDERAAPLIRGIDEIVAAAVLLRLHDVEGSGGRLAELGLDDGASRRVLARFRKRFLEEQSELLRRVARLLDEDAARPARGLLTRARGDDHVAICAWCECVRDATGEWLPIGHFVPREGSLRVTHGICPACAAHEVRASA